MPFGLSRDELRLVGPANATVFGTVRGIVHDPDHRPVAAAEVLLQAVASDYKQTGRTGTSGEF